MQPQHKQSAPHTAQRGTSLIEILVVLVILVVGILSIVRLFPAGFIALRNAENDTFADRLAQGALEQLKKSGNGLPDAIYMYSTADGFIPTFAPTDFNKSYTPAGASAPNAAYNDINKQRYISNETITVPAPHVIGGTSYPPLYAVSYGPIYLPKEYATLMTPAVSVRYLPINSLPWTLQSGDARTDVSDPSRSIDNPMDILQAGQQKAVIDYGAGQIAVPQASYDQVYTLAVTPTSPANSAPMTVTFLVHATSGTNGYNGNWSASFFDPAAPANALSLPAGPWVPGSATLYRPFRYMGIYGQMMSTPFDNDPYEFKVFNGMSGGSSIGTDSNMGVIAFNPVAAGQNGSQPLKARISYMALDWHILHEDQNIASGGSSVRLTLNHLKKIGDTQFDQTLYNGLIADAATPADLMLLDLDTGAVTSLNSQTGAGTTNGASGVGVIDSDQTNAPDTTKYQISYQNGRVTFPNGSAAQHVRFFYAGDADWALAVQKAPSAYKIVNADANGNVRTPVAADYQVLTTPGPATPNNCVIDTAAQRAYFPVCDAGKTVEFDGISYTSTGTSQSPVQVGEASAPISTDYAAPSAGGSALPYVNLSNSGLNGSAVITSGIAPNTFRVLAVRGVSAQATVIWHERNQWRTRTVDTLLTQTQ